MRLRLAATTALAALMPLAVAFADWSGGIKYNSKNISSISTTTVSATNLYGANISGSTVTGGTLSGTAVNGASISGSTVTGGTVSGTALNTATISATFANITSTATVYNRLIVSANTLGVSATASRLAAKCLSTAADNCGLTVESSSGGTTLNLGINASNGLPNISNGTSANKLYIMSNAIGVGVTNTIASLTTQTLGMISPTTLPVCNASNKGVLYINTTTNCLNYCDGTANRQITSVAASCT